MLLVVSIAIGEIVVWAEPMVHLWKVVAASAAGCKIVQATKVVQFWKQAWKFLDEKDNNNKSISNSPKWEQFCRYYQS